MQAMVEVTAHSTAGKGKRHRDEGGDVGDACSKGKCNQGGVRM